MKVLPFDKTVTAPLFMSTTLISPRATNIGAMTIQRLLPWKTKRMCGPFIFFDHMGPQTLNHPGEIDVEPHPHIGLSTLTWLLSGELIHRDSLGTEQIIRPGAVNWMTSGTGIVHSERSVAGSQETTFEGIQLWVALPKNQQTIAPSFQHIRAEDVPCWEEEGLRYQLVAGEWGEHQSPLKTHSDTLMLQLTATHQGTMDLDFDEGFELGLYVLSGDVVVHEEVDQRIDANHLFIKDSGFSFTYEDDARFLLIGGETFETVPNIWWNFVAFDKEDIENAKERWRNQQFKPVPGETDFVPLPQNRKI